jgi:hypothetical protein
MQLNERSSDALQSACHARRVEPRASYVAVVQEHHTRQLREVRRVCQYARGGSARGVQVDHAQYFDMLARMVPRAGQAVEQVVVEAGTGAVGNEADALVQQGKDGGIESFARAKDIYERLFPMVWFQLHNDVVEKLAGKTEERGGRWQIRRN